MDKLLLMGVSSDTKYAIDYCKSIGVYTIVTDNIPYEKSKAKQMADEYWMIDLKDIDALKKKCRESSITGVYAGNNEFCLDQTRLLAKRLGLPFYASDMGWEAARNKRLFKQYCIAAGLNVPKQYEYTKDDDPEKIQFPVIVKPADSSVSRGISVCRNKEELPAAYEYAMKFSQKGEVVVEDYIDGPEVFLYVFIKDGKVIVTYFNHILFNISGNTHADSGSMFLWDRNNMKIILDNDKERIVHLFENMNCKNGVANLQARIKDGKACWFELGYRLPGGVCNSIYMKELFGLHEVETMVDFALGREPKYDTTRNMMDIDKSIGVSYLLVRSNPGRIAKIEDQILHEIDGLIVEVQRYDVGMEVKDTPGMLQAGYYFVIYSDSVNDLIHKIELLNANLKWLDENGNNLLEPFVNFDGIKNVLS